MNTLVVAETLSVASGSDLPVQWPQPSAEELYASSLNAYPQAVRHWFAGFGVDVQPTSLTANEGLLLEVFWRAGQLVLWIENHGSPFLDALCQGNELPHPDWLTACLHSLWTGDEVERSNLKVQGARKAQRPVQCKQGWSWGAGCIGFTACDETAFHEFSKGFRSPHALADIGITTNLIVSVGLQSISELQRLEPGDAVVLAPDINMPIAALWAWGVNCAVAAQVNVNLLANVMVFEGEIRNMSATSQNQFAGQGTSMLELSGIDIPIAFEIETGVFTLQQVQSLAPGQLIYLRSDPRQCRIRLLAAGQCVASGLLVQIGNALAVRLEQVQGSGAQP